MKTTGGGAHVDILPDFPRQRLTVVLALATLVSAFGSSFQYGYNVAVISSPEEVTMAKKCRSRDVSNQSSVTMCLSSGDEAVLQSHPSGALRPAHGGKPAHSALVRLRLHVPAGGLLWVSDGGSSGQQTGEVTCHVCRK